MHTVTLLTDPAAPVLDPSGVDDLAARWEGGAVRWLAPGAAAAFDCAALPGDLDRAAGELREQGIDLAVRPADAGPMGLLIADMDSTMIGQECIDELAEMAGVGERVRAITARAMAGELDFEGALRERVGLLAGLDAGIVERVLAERIAPAPGARVLVATMRARGAHTALVSGGFTLFTGPVAAALGFHEHRANTLEVADGRLTGRVVPPVLGREAKAAALQEIAARRGLGPRAAVAVGDGANDLAMLGLAGLGVAMHAKPAVAAAASVRLDHADLTGILYLQGIARADFVGDEAA